MKYKFLKNEEAKKFKQIIKDMLEKNTKIISDAPDDEEILIVGKLITIVVEKNGNVIRINNIIKKKNVY